MSSKTYFRSSGAITHIPNISWNIVSASVIGTTGENNHTEDLINNGGFKSSAIDTVACKMSSSKVDPTPVKVASSNGDVRYVRKNFVQRKAGLLVC